MRVLYANVGAGHTPITFCRVIHNLRAERQRLGIVTPPAAQGVSFQEHRRAYSRAVVKRTALNIKNYAFHINTSSNLV